MNQTTVGILVVGCVLVFLFVTLRDRLNVLTVKDAERSVHLEAESKPGGTLNQVGIGDLINVSPGATVQTGPTLSTPVDIPKLMGKREELLEQIKTTERELNAAVIMEADATPNKQNGLKERIKDLRKQVEIIDGKLKSANRVQRPPFRNELVATGDSSVPNYIQASNDTNATDLAKPATQPLERKLVRLIAKVDRSVATVKVPPGGRILIEASWNTDKEQQIVITPSVGDEEKIMRHKGQLTWQSPMNTSPDYALYRIKAEEKTDTWHAGELMIIDGLEAQYHRAYIGWKQSEGKNNDTMARIIPEGFPLQ